MLRVQVSIKLTHTHTHILIQRFLKMVHILLYTVYTVTVQVGRGKYLPVLFHSH